MAARLTGWMQGTGVMQRAMRSGAITILGFGATQGIRLASNLILTRLLFPEAFGMMAIITVFIVGLQLLSDIGLNQSIMASPRGDEPAFLDTAWTIQVGRGVVLWLAACAVAWPLAQVYAAPDLLWYLPVTALMMVIAGFNPTRLQSAWRHLQSGRITLAEVGAQLAGIIVAIALAWWFQSVWALVASNIATALAYLLLLNALLPGHRNRLRWDPTAASELIGFGKWVFLSTLCGFATMQADKLLIGEYLSLADFGLYNIAFFLASFPFVLGAAVMGRLVIPVFRDHPPAQSPQNYARLRRMRLALSGGMMALCALIAFGGVWLVQVMYDPRYHLAGGLAVLIAVVHLPQLVIQSGEQVALAAGDSRRFFALTLARAVVVIIGLWLGLQAGGVEGALIGLGLAHLAVYPVLAWLLRPHGAWDPVLDAGLAAFGLAIAFGALWLNAPAVAALTGLLPG